MNPELMELRDSARQVLTDGGLVAAEDKSWPLVLDLGWLLISVPEALDGLGHGLTGACAFYDEFGRSLSAAPYVPAMLAIDAVCHSALADRERWLQRLTTRDYVTTPLADTALVIEATGSGSLRLNGLATAVPSADKAGHVLVSSRDGQHVALVSMQQAGVKSIQRPTWDTSRRLFDVRFAEVELDSRLVLASGAAAQALCRRLAVHRDFALAAGAVGGARAVLELTVEYLKTRRQFGRPLALFQALKHRCADLQAQVCGAEALLQDALIRAGQALDAPAAEAAGRGVKLQACSVYAHVAEEALQLHGGIGMTAEHSCHRYLKRALLDAQLGRSGYAQDLASVLLDGP